ncbi:hypothetical protein NM208_g7931 [Fusarium decemcellulare]|uniref:Uncharacterized protein n=1 Tax=Fusarium decemcellulare TaxID=57161 RepID=A0ACC1S7F0_9HYPO|nr:hypothetical protein NM208_g7931 [Fusarium decemcellulare]
MESIQQAEPDNPKKRKRSHHGRTRIEVHLRSKPRDYVSGSGPPLQRISLLPPQDTTAYILERIILPSPGLAADGQPLPRRMTYIVGWHDLPAATMLVPAMDVLEYVSPRELEEWEFKNMEEQMDRAKVDKQEQAVDNVSKPKKRRGRPPKHSQIETAVVAVPESDTEALPKKGVMTISTPNKNRMKDFEGLSDEEGSPSRQLQREMSGEFAGLGTDQGFEESDMAPSEMSEDVRAGTAVGPLHEAGLGTWMPNQSRAAGKQILDSLPSTETSTRQSTPKPAAAKPSLKASKKTSATSSSKNKSRLSAVINGAGQGTLSGSDWTWTPIEESVTNSNSEVETPDPEPEQVMAGLLAEAESVKKQPVKKPEKVVSKTSTPAPPPEEQPPEDKGKDNGEPVWEVKRLEDMELYEVEGTGLVRYFKVRWEGDWPPDQNPSWEPEYNLPSKLIRNYLKQGKKRRVGGASPAAKKKDPMKQATYTAAPARSKKSSLKQTTLSWGIPARQFKSVSEAFAGGEEEAIGMAIEDEAAFDDGDEGEELFVVEEESPVKKKHRKAAPSGNGTTSGMGMSIMQSMEADAWF